MPLTVRSASSIATRHAAHCRGHRSGDVTTCGGRPASARARRAAGEVDERSSAGLDVAREVFRQVDPGDPCVRSRGRWRRVPIAGEIARRRRRAAAAPSVGRADGTQFPAAPVGHRDADPALRRRGAAGSTVLDTRKTTPGYRALARYAVRCGGAAIIASVYDGVLIKDNHIRLAGGVAAAVARVRAAGWTRADRGRSAESGEVDEALAAGADIIMLDNFDDAMTEGDRGDRWSREGRDFGHDGDARAPFAVGGRRLRVGRRDHAFSAGRRHQLGDHDRAGVMTSTFDPLPADLAAAIDTAPDARGPWTLRYLSETDSTNDVALDLALAGCLAGTAVLAGSHGLGADAAATRGSHRPAPAFTFR